MLQEMDQSEFGQFVAALWERQGWQTQIKRDGDRLFVTVQRPETGEEGLLWAIADDDVGGKQVQQFQSLCDEYGVAERAVVTTGTLSEHAQKVAEGTGVDLLDGEGITTILERKGLTDLAEQYGSGKSGSGDGTESAGSDDGSPLDALTAVGGQVFALVSNAVEDATEDADLPVSGTVVAVVVVVALLGAGVVFGPSLPFLGGSGDDISAESVSPENSTTTLHVEWNTKVVDEIDPNESDEKAYYPPAGEQFVLVRLSINNTGETTVTLTQAAFEFRTAEQTYGHQTLADHDGFVDFSISSGTHYIGWTVFSVPEGTTGTLVYDQNETDVPVAVTFERDSDLPVNVTRL